MDDFPISPKSENQTLHEWVYAQLRHAIMIGSFAPGVSVTMRGLAKTLDVSLMPVREALRRLVAEQALKLLPNRRVTIPPMTVARFDELCATRITLECLAAERALLAVNEEDIAALWACNERMNRALTAADIVTALKENQAFHRRIYLAAPSEVLFPLIDNLWLQFGPFMRDVLEHFSDEFKGGTYVVDRHEEAINAILGKDAYRLRLAIEADLRDGFGALGKRGLLGINP